jgi:hypothetical protein
MLDAYALGQRLAQALLGKRLAWTVQVFLDDAM